MTLPNNSLYEQFANISSLNNTIYNLLGVSWSPEFENLNLSDFGIPGCEYKLTDPRVESCMTASDEMYTSITYAVSLPAIGVALRLSPVAALVDEFTYYQYHEARYDLGFRYLTEMCWNFTNSKWIPPFINVSAVNLDVLFEAVSSQDIRHVTPNRFYANR